MKKERQMYSQEQVKKFGEFFKSGKSIQQTADEFGVKYHTMKTYLTKYGFREPIKKYPTMKGSECNHDYFSCINTEKKSIFF